MDPHLLHFVLDQDVAGLRRISMHSTKGLKTDEKSTATSSVEDRYLDANDSTGRSTFTGTAINKDIVVAAAHAYVAALNRLLAADKSGNSVKGAGDIGASV